MTDIEYWKSRAEEAERKLRQMPKGSRRALGESSFTSRQLQQSIMEGRLLPGRQWHVPGMSSRRLALRDALVALELGRPLERVCLPGRWKCKCTKEERNETDGLCQWLENRRLMDLHLPIPDAWSVDIERRELCVVEVNVHHHQDPLPRFTELWWECDGLEATLRCFIVDRHGVCSEPVTEEHWTDEWYRRTFDAVKRQTVSQ